LFKDFDFRFREDVTTYQMDINYKLTLKIKCLNKIRKPVKFVIMSWHRFRNPKWGGGYIFFRKYTIIILLHNKLIYTITIDNNFIYTQKINK